MRSLRHRVVVITGSTNSIGTATAERLAWSGANLVLADGDEAALNRQRDYFSSAASQPLTVHTDVSDFRSLRTMFQTCLHRFGVIDVLVNCAGVIRPGSLDTVTPESIREQLHVNVLGTIYSTQLLLPTFRQQRKGHFIHVAWLGGSVPLPLEAPYSATVAAVRGFCMAMSLELRNTPINISIICADSDALRDGKVDRQDPYLPFRRKPLMAHDIARAIVQTTKRPRLEVHISRLSSTLMKLGCFSPRLLRLVHPSYQRLRARDRWSVTGNSGY